MKHIKKPLSVVVGAMLLSACGGGKGSFDNPAMVVVGANPKPALPTPKDNPPKDPPQDPTPADDITKPTLNSAMPFVKRNLFYAYQEDGGHHLQEHAKIPKEALTHDTPEALLEKLKENHPNAMIYQSSHDDYDYVKAGWVFTGLYAPEYLEGQNTQFVKGDGYLYYQGIQPATTNIKGKLSYQGHWDFMTDAKRVRDYDRDKEGFGGGTAYGMDGQFGDEVSATSFAEQVFGQVAPRQGNHRAMFDVDFDNKTLTGTLSTKKQKTKNQEPSHVERYKIEANVVGNRFVGSAKASNQAGEFNLFAKDATNRLEGGFFGEQASELAGKFLSDDDSVFAVFAGKSTHQTTFEPKYDGVYLELTQDDALNPAQTSQRLPLANFGDVNRLYLNGRLIELLPLKDKATDKFHATQDGQTLVISSFGTADGMLRLGLIQRSAKTPSPDDNQPSQQQVGQAKEALQEYIDAQKQHLEDLLGDYVYADDPEAVHAQILTQALLGYPQDEQAQAKTRLLELLKALSENPEDGESFDEILALFESGQKFDVNQEQNWQAYLPKPQAQIPTYSEAQMAVAKNALQEALNEAKGELEGLLELYVQSEEEQEELAQSITQKIQEAYSKTTVGDEIENLLADLSVQDTQERAKQRLMALLQQGDKFDGSLMDNLKAYLPTLPSVLAKPLDVNSSLSGLYLLGERTPVDDMPKAGVMNYHGTWHGKIGHHWQSEAGYGQYDGKSKFRVNFADKSLTGALVEKRGVEPAFEISAKIQGNAFYGTATSRHTGINLDAGRQQNQQILPATISNNLQGAFYGENAKHLGGSFSFETRLQDSTETVLGGAVFYGTKE